MLSMHFNQYWQILQGRIKVVIITFGAIVLTTALMLAMTPNTYTATASLNFDFQGSNPYMDVRTLSPSAEGSYITTQISIIKSQHVAKKVVDNLSQSQREQLISAMDGHLTILDRLMGELFSRLRGAVDLFSAESQTAVGQESLNVPDPNSGLALALTNNLKVTPVIGSRIVTLEYSSTDPSVSALITNAYVRAYTNTNLEMLIDPAKRTAVWFDERLGTLRHAAEAAQTKLAVYQQQEGIVATDERFDIESKRLTDLTTQLLDAQVETRKSVTSQQQVEELQSKRVSLDNIPEFQNNASIQKAKDEVRQYEAKLAELSSRLGDNHPQFQRMMLELNAAKRRLSNEFGSLVQGANNSVKIALERERSVERALAAQKQVVLQFKSERGAMDMLNREVESAQAAYNSALKQFNESSLQSLVTQTNISVIDAAQVPRHPSGPNIGQNMGLAVLVGLMLGIGIAFGWELIDRRVRSREDLLADLSLPVLGTLERV